MIDDINSLLVTLCPLLFLPFMTWWRAQNTLDKCVTASLAIWCVGATFTRHLAIQSFCLFALFAFISACKNHYFKIHTKWYYLLFVYFIWHAISLLWMPEFLIGLKHLRIYSLFVFIPLIFSCINLNKTQLNGILVVFARVIMLYTIISLLFWVYKSYQLNVPLSEWIIISKKLIAGSNVYDIVYSWCNYYHPTYNGIVICMALAVSFYKTSSSLKESHIHYLETLFFIFSSLLLIIITQSRMSLVLWGITCFCGIGYLLRNYKLKYLYYLTVIICVFLGTHLGEDRIVTFIKDKQRVQNIKTAFYFIEQHPVLGSGIEGIRAEMADHEVAKKLGYPYANVDLGNPHHQFIGDLMQTGIVGLLLIIAIMSTLAYNVVKQRSWILGMFWIISFILMQIEMPFYLHKGVVFFCLFACLLSFDNTKKITE